jgi:hypothetical protein
MGAIELLRHLQSIGLNLSRISGDKIKVEPKSTLTEATLQLIRAHKVGLLTALEAEEAGQDIPLSRTVTARTCANCVHLTVFGNCREPVQAGLAERFELIEPELGYGADCKAFADRRLLDPASNELISLLDVIAAFHGFTPKERQEALEIALGDPESALRCFRSLVNQGAG